MSISNFPLPYIAIPVAPSWPVKGQLTRISAVDFSDDRARRGRQKGDIALIVELSWLNASLDDLTTLINFWVECYGVKPVSWFDATYNTTRLGFIVSELSWSQNAENAFDVRGVFEFEYTPPAPVTNSLPLNPSAVITTSIDKTTRVLFSDDRNRYSRSRGLPYSQFNLTFVNRSISDLTAMQSFWSVFYPQGLITWSDPSTGYDWEGYITENLQWEFFAACSVQIQMSIEMVRVGQDNTNTPGSIPWPN